MMRQHQIIPTETEDLASARNLTDNSLSDFIMSHDYAKMTKLYAEKIMTSTRRFHLHEVTGQDFESDQSFDRPKCLCCFSRPHQIKQNMFQLPYSELTESDKRERIKYLWFRVRIFCVLAMMVNALRWSVTQTDIRKMTKVRVQVVYEKEEI